MFKERRAGSSLLRLMYIAETLINPLFTDVAFRRDREGDGSGHYESGGVMSPPYPVPSARLLKIEIVMLRFFLLFQRLKAQSLSQLVCSNVVNAKMWVFSNVGVLTLGILRCRIVNTCLY